MTMQTPMQIARDIAGELTRGPFVTISELLEILEAAIEADRDQRADRTVWVIQDENGDVLDATDSLEYAEWLTRDNEDVPLRSKTDVTVWSGPEKREEW